jgi:hypothetical protein
MNDFQHTQRQIIRGIRFSGEHPDVLHQRIKGLLWWIKIRQNPVYACFPELLTPDIP